MNNQSKKCILITGTPGTGKTTLAKYLSKRYNISYWDIEKIHKEYPIKSGYDSTRKCPLIDINKLRIATKKIIITTKSVCIIDTHVSHHIKPQYTATCILCTAPLKIIYTRLKKRKYTEKKIRENLDSEIFEIIKNEALEYKHNIISYPSTGNKKILKTIELMVKNLLKKSREDSVVSQKKELKRK